MAAVIFHVDEVEVHEPFQVQYGSTNNPILTITDFRDWPLRHKQAFLRGAEVSQRQESLRKKGSTFKPEVSDSIAVISTIRTLGLNMNEEDRSYFDDLPEQAQLNIAKGFMATIKANKEDAE